jgi:hypothetical protein
MKCKAKLNMQNNKTQKESANRMLHIVFSLFAMLSKKKKNWF